MNNITVGIPQSIFALVQNGLLERAFHDSLFPSLMYRQEAQWEEWEGHVGTEILMSRAGLLAPRTKALAPGQEPSVLTLNYEQWIASLARYGDAIDTHMPTSATSSMDQFVKNIQALGLQAGMSLNRIPRNILYKTYLGGQTVLIQATASMDTSIRVASCNGFTDVVGGSTVRPTTVGQSSPKSITIYNGATAIVRNVIGFDLDDATDIHGPGTLLLSATVGAIVAVRSSVLAYDKPRVIRAGGGSSIDALGASDIMTLQDAINATNWLRKNNVQPHEDGYFHGHINTDANGQIFQDPAFQRLQTSLPNGEYYQQAFIGTIAGIAFYSNNENPDSTNSGLRTATGTNAMYSEDIGAETTNESGVNVGRVIVTGRSAIYERGLDEKKAFATEAGMNGKEGDFQITNNGVAVSTDRIRLILRAPIDRFQDTVSAAWSITTSFPVPSDITAGGPERYKRAVVIEHAKDS